MEAERELSLSLSRLSGSLDEVHAELTVRHRLVETVNCHTSWLLRLIASRRSAFFREREKVVERLRERKRRRAERQKKKEERASDRRRTEAEREKKVREEERKRREEDGVPDEELIEFLIGENSELSEEAREGVKEMLLQRKTLWEKEESKRGSGGKGNAGTRGTFASGKKGNTSASSVSSSSTRTQAKGARKPSAQPKGASKPARSIQGGARSSAESTLKRRGSLRSDDSSSVAVVDAGSLHKLLMGGEEEFEEKADLKRVAPPLISETKTYESPSEEMDSGLEADLPDSESELRSECTLDDVLDVREFRRLRKARREAGEGVGNFRGKRETAISGRERFRKALWGENSSSAKKVGAKKLFSAAENSTFSPLTTSEDLVTTFPKASTTNNSVELTLQSLAQSDALDAILHVVLPDVHDGDCRPEELLVAVTLLNWLEKLAVAGLERAKQLKQEEETLDQDEALQDDCLQQQLSKVESAIQGLGGAEEGTRVARGRAEMGAEEVFQAVPQEVWDGWEPISVRERSAVGAFKRMFEKMQESGESLSFNPLKSGLKDLAMRNSGNPSGVEEVEVRLEEKMLAAAEEVAMVLAKTVESKKEIDGKSLSERGILDVIKMLDYAGRRGETKTLCSFWKDNEMSSI